MKKILQVILIGFTFLLASCGEESDVAPGIPGLSLIGDSSLVIEEGEPFIDPGVDIIGDFDLEIVTESNVDVDTLGTYKITYTIEYNEITYDIVRTVVVVDGILMGMDLEITDFDITEDEASFTINVTDDNDILLNTFAVIYNGSTIVSSYPFTDGTQSITYGNFLPNTLYRIVLEGEYKAGSETRTLSGYFLEFTTTNFDVVVPEIMLTGEKDIYIDVYSEYSDEGAYLIEPFILDITSVSTVDSSIIGDYTITYSVDYKNQTYSVVRNVHVLDFQALIGELNIVNTKSNVGFTSFDAFVSITDPNGHLKDLKIVLTQMDEVIAEYNINNGDNLLNFTDLVEGTTYVATLQGTYDNGTVNIELSNYYYNVYIPINSWPMTRLIASEVRPESYLFNVILTDTYERVYSADYVVYLDNVEIDRQEISIGDLNYSFEGLTENTTYKVVLKLQVKDAGYKDKQYYGITGMSIDIETFTTPSIPTPTVNSDSCIAFTTSVECTMDMDVTGFSDVSIDYSIFIGNDVQASLSLTDGATKLTFEDLLDNQEYTVKISATYTEDATGITYMYQRIKIITVVTKEIVTYTTPSIENLVVTPSFVNGVLNITVGFDLLDPDETIGSYLYFYLSSGSSKYEIPVVGHNEYTYSGYLIYENTEYTVKVKATYNTSAEETVYEEELILYEFTSPLQMTVDSFSALDTFFVGDNIVFIVELDNKKDMDIDSITINDVVYDTFMFPSNQSKLYIDSGVAITESTQDYVLSAVTVTLVDETSFVIDQNDTINVIVHGPSTFIPNDATVTVLELTVNDHTTHVTDGVDNKKIVSIVVENEFDLAITKIKIDGVEYTNEQFAISNNVITVSLPITRGRTDYKLQDLEFTRNNYTYDADLSAVSELYVYGYETEDIVSITTVEEFINMDGDNSKYYRLDADLDFAGFTVNPKGEWQDTFGGCFDGNGHVMTNIYITTTVSNKINSTYVGLFGWSTSYLYDITIDNIDIVVTSDGSSSLYVGTLAGRSTGPVYNVSVIGDSSITINGITNEYVGGLIGLQEGDVRDLYANVDINIDELEIDNVVNGTYRSLSVGGLLGGSKYGDVDTSHSSGNISLININRGINFVGGLVGDYLSGDANAYISNSYSTVNINIENSYEGRTGGLVGRALYTGDDSGIINSYSSGTLFSNAGKLGGLVGEGQCMIYNTFSTSTISTSNASMGMLFGKGNEYRMFNSYLYDGQVVTREDEIVVYGNDYHWGLIVATPTQFNDIEFYYNHLDWNSYFFNFTNLNVEDADLPVFN